MTAPTVPSSAVETRDSVAGEAPTSVSVVGRAWCLPGKTATGTEATSAPVSGRGGRAAGANAAAAREGRAPWQSSALPRLLWAVPSWGRDGTTA